MSARHSGLVSIIILSAKRYIYVCYYSIIVCTIDILFSCNHYIYKCVWPLFLGFRLFNWLIDYLYIAWSEKRKKKVISSSINLSFRKIFFIKWMKYFLENCSIIVTLTKLRRWKIQVFYSELIHQSNNGALPSRTY